ncbi:MAG: hypothetical protein HQ534_02455 [Armatimonadetes bacterium]|nr:hypothetical protein [Armatimonadota bacterium]
MGMIEMLSILLAIILFSTILISMYHNISIAMDIVYNGLYQLQGQKITNKYFQKIDAELLCHNDNFTFSNIYSTYNSYTDTETVNNIQYNISMQASYCDSIGATSADSTLGFRIIDMSVWCFPPTSSDTLWIGTSANPIQTVFASYE